MKMLTDQQIDYHAARVIANVHDWQEHLSVIIAQAKLANELKTARNDALEEAAAIVDNIEPIDCNGLSVQDIAEAIRAAKAKLEQPT